MSRDYSLADLAGEAAEEAATEAGGEAVEAAAEETAESSLKWGVELYERMQQDGTLELLLFGPENANMERETPADPSEDSTIDPTESLNAETIGNVCELVIDKVGDKRLSEVQAACEERPSTINSVIEMYGDELMGDEPAVEEAGDDFDPASEMRGQE